MNMATIPQKLDKEVKIFIVQTINEVLNDPDFGLALTERAKKRLRLGNISQTDTTPFSKIKEKYY